MDNEEYAQIETIDSSASSLKRKSPDAGLMKGWQAALAYGVPIGLLAGGPIGAAVGAAAGLFSHLQRNAWVDRETKMSAAIHDNENDTDIKMQRELEQARAAGNEERVEQLEDIQQTRDAGYRLWMAGEPRGLEMMLSAGAKVSGMIASDAAARAQREEQARTMAGNLIQTAAASYRGEYDNVRQTYAASNEVNQRILGMLNDPSFDPNAPESKAYLADLIQVGVGGMYRDKRDMLDSITDGVKGLPSIVGQIAGSVADIGVQMFKDKKEWTREDYYRVVFNSQRTMQKATYDALERLKGQSQQLNKMGADSKTVHPEFDMWQYVSGGADNIQMLEVPKAPTSSEVLEKMPQPKRLQSTPYGATGKWSASIPGMQRNTFTRPIFKNGRRVRPTN